MSTSSSRSVQVTVLLAEDKPLIRELTARILRSMGMQVLEASDGVSALELAANYPAPIDLLVADLVMPRLDGMRLAEQLQAARPGVKVLFLTGVDEQALEGWRLHPGSAAIRKPFQLIEFEKAVRSTLSQE